MLIEFQPVPVFSEGQLLSAADLNTFNQNNTMAKKLFAAPQPLFMDSHAYAPKALPLYWRDPDFTIWEGSFIYRDGMEYAYLGLQVKIDGIYTNNTNVYPISDFGTDAEAVNIGVIVKYTEFTYKNIYVASGIYTNYYASAPLHEVAQGANVISRKSTYTFSIADGASTNVATDTNSGYLNKNSRISEIKIKLDSLTLTDGELVPIKLLLLVNADPRKSDPKYKDVFKPKYGNFNNFFILRDSNPLSSSQVINEHIYYSHLYAYTDGDLSYTDNWPSVSGVVTTGSGVLSTSNIQKLTGKQRYITDRLKNRPMPLTGCILYLSLYGGSAALRYPQFDVVPGQWEYSKEEYAQPISNSMDEFAIAGDNVTKIVNGAGRVNPQSNLATFSWNPAFELYNQPTVSFKYFGNTDSRQVLIIDFTEAPVSQTDTRNNFLTIGGRTTRSGHLFGYFGGSGVATSTGYYGSIYAGHDMASFVDTASNDKIYKNHLFQVRIPSPNTRVYSPQFNRYTTENDFFLTSGFWEDQVQITFEEKASGLWGLKKLGGYTTQFGFVGDFPVNTLKELYPPRFYDDEFEKQYVRYTGYNDGSWNWRMNAGDKGYSQIFVNIYDHSGQHYRAKANYISYCFLIGIDDFKVADSQITLPAVYSGNSLLTYNSVVSAITEINDDLDESYAKLFVNNPHFKNYNMFWGSPKSTVNMRHIYKDYTDKFHFFTRQRTGNILIVRGKNVSIYYGEIKKLKRDGSPFGSLHKIDDVDVEFEYSENIVSGDSEQTKIFHLSSLANLAYNQRYYIQGETLIYAAEFFEEPS